MEEKQNVESTQQVDLRREKVRVIPIQYIDDFPDHPFQVREDEEMNRLVESIKEYGVLTPVVARRAENNRFELISGHRRKRACQIAGIEVIPLILRDLTREEAIIAMVDSNLQREHILPSEKAFAYKMKLEAMKRQGQRTDLTCVPMAHKLKGEKSREIVAEQAGESADQVRRYIRLTELVPELLEMVDQEKIAFRPAVELSYLTEEEQRNLVETIDSEEVTPSLGQALRMKHLSKEGKLDMDTIFSIMQEQKGNQKEIVKIPAENLERFFPRGTPPKRIMDEIFAALEFYRSRYVPTASSAMRKREDRDER